MKISSKEVYTIFSHIFSTILWLTLILYLLDIYVYFFVNNIYLRELFNFASEKTPATWLSSTILLILAACFLLLWKLLNENRWQFLGYFYIYLSLDDASYVHEQISSWIVNENEFLYNLPSYGWLYIIAPFIFLGLGYAYTSLFKKLQKFNLSIKSLVLSFITLAVFLDFLDGYISKNLISISQTHYLRVTEEALEIVAFALLIHSVSLLVIEVINRSSDQSNNKGKKHGKKS